MKDSFMNSEGKIIFEKMVEAIKENKDYLSEIDAQLGDGDHGINMNKGFSSAYNKIKGKEINFSDSLEVLGNTLLNEIGGSMGPLYGIFFLKMSETIKEKENINKYDFSKMLHNAIDGIKELTDAEIGEKTLIDTLLPAAYAFDKSIDKGKNFFDALLDLIKAAQEGKNATKDMIARYGRGSRLKESSIGKLDVGAVSCYIILNSIANTIRDILQKN